MWYFAMDTRILSEGFSWRVQCRTPLEKREGRAERVGFQSCGLDSQLIWRLKRGANHHPRRCWAVRGQTAPLLALEASERPGFMSWALG